MRRFDPARVARLERASWVAYYQKRWLRLLQVFIDLVRSTYGLSLPKALKAAYWLTRAQVAFAPVPHNDVPLAESYMRRFFAYLQQIHGERFDVDEVARCEVHWWVVHRQCFGQSDAPALVDALTQAYAAAYNIPPAQVREAALHRARAMVYSDRWVKDGLEGKGLPADSPLLDQEEHELLESYRALRQAVIDD
jgi:hypothetical protein